jgi:hypothetical protein
MRVLICAMVIILLSGCLASEGQQSTEFTTTADTAPPPSQRFPEKWYPPVPNEIPEAAGPVRNAPFTAIPVTTAKFPKPETGKVDVQVRESFTARDSEGRTRTDDPPDYGHGGGVLAHDVRVVDPVSHCSYHWVEPDVTTPGGPIAIVECLPPVVRYVSFDVFSHLNSTSQRDSTSELGTSHGEPLGKRMFGEVEAVGVHNTNTLRNPEPGQMATTGVQVWYAPSIKEIVQLSDDPELPGGAPDMELTNIHLGEPSRDLFYPPPGYRILTLAELNDAFPPPPVSDASQPQ